MENRQKEFEYHDPKFLNELLLNLTDNCIFSAHLMPDIDEFIEASKKSRPSNLSTFQVPEKLKAELDSKKINYYQWHSTLMYNLSMKHNIIPLWQLRFNGQCGPDNEINYIGDRIDEVGEELYYFFNSPRTLALGDKFTRIVFNDCGKRHREAAEEYLKRGYRATYLTADLNPRSGTSDHYYSRYDCDARLRAQNGVITIDGKFPDDFDPTKIEKRKLTENTKQKALPGILNLLEI